MKIEPQIVTVSGQDWNVAVIGPEDAERTLLLCNGIGASLDTIGPFAEHFKRTRLVAFDVPGVGQSPTPVVPYRFANLSRMLNRVLDQLGIGDVDVFGVSWGGALAQQFVRDNQRRCRTMTLAATSAGFVMVPGNVSVLSKMMTPRRYNDPDYLFSIAAEIYGGEVAFNQELLKDHAMAMQSGNGKGYFYQLLAVWGWTSYLWLNQIKVPSLILMGRDDPLVPLVNGKILARRLRNSQLETVDCGHLFMLTQAERVADRVEEFLFAENAELV